MEGSLMPRHKLGKTGLELSALGFGASPLGGAFGSIDENQGIAAVHATAKAGVNYFDTSPYYGLTKSETVLGRALADLPRSSYVLSTKVGRYGVSEFDFSAARVTSSLTESMQRLGVSYVDILLCHDVEFGDLNQVINETLPALRSLKAQGLIGAVGFSALPLPVFRHILDRTLPGDVDVVLSYCHHCLNDSTLVDMLPFLHEKGVGVIGASPLAMGLLTKEAPPSWHPAPKELTSACAAAASHSSSLGVDISKLALSYSLRVPGVASTLVGMATPEQVETNVQTTLQALGVVPNPQAELESRAEKEVLQLLAPVQGLTWPSGRQHDL